MGKLNIAHHKSYHPYRRDNIERVRRDEEEARLKEAQEEGRMMLADSEARMDLLRAKAGLKVKDSKGKSREKDDGDSNQIQTHPAPLAMQQPALTTSSGHINLFEDLEHGAMEAIARSSKKKADPAETDKGVPLAPSSKDLNPWYSSRKSGEQSHDDGDEERRKRDKARQAMHDPLTSISRQLASSRQPSSSSSTSSRYQLNRVVDPLKPPEVNARLTRESSERARAQELIRRKKREMMGSETPSTVHGGGYDDVFNKREVQEAHRGRERHTRRW
ncbi:hypothetical protein ONZ45_g3488 [Pleurotus djamor]|nr:hypothetical protein ONZ45_g3488 [Pleurotus djamor]